MNSVDLQHLWWHTSSRSGNSGNCVEVAELPDGARRVRDTKERDGGTLSLRPAQWSAFTEAIKAGRLV